MATFMSSAFTAPDRRKKIVTYGKKSRLPTIPVALPENDATSPERPRKHVEASQTASVKSRSSLLLPSRARDASPDIFDVPSDDDFGFPSPATVPKSLTKRRVNQADGHPMTLDEQIQEELRQAQSSGEESIRGKSTSKAIPAATKPTKQPFQTTRPLASDTTAKESPLPRGRRGLTPQPTQSLAKDRPDSKSAIKATATANGKENARPRTQAAAPTRAPHGKTTTSVVVPQAERSKSSVVRSRTPDVFDLPSSDDEAHLPTPKPIRRAPTSTTRVPPKKTESAPIGKGKEEELEEEPKTLTVQKRKASVSSLRTSSLADARERDTLLPQHSRKQQKQEPTLSESRPPTMREKTPSVQPTIPSINKPRRTRTRTVPVLAQPAIAKGQSSPATLQGMLPRREAPRPLPVVEEPASSALEDETMYDIPDSSSTPARPSTRPSSGSVTPRQKALFGSLLGSAGSNATPLPSISKLQLTDRKPPSILGALSRSKSDLTHGPGARKSGLLSKLKPRRESSDDATSETGSSSEEEDDTIVDAKRNEVPTSKTDGGQNVADHVLDDKDVHFDAEPVADSQTSQATSGYGSRARNTYAKSRSYLQEANPEDALLMSMDLDDPMPASQRTDSQLEEEDEASQIRATHELKSLGQNSADQFENQTLLDDMAITQKASLRRNAIMELCTKMADSSFAHAILNSSLDRQFLANTESNGEIIFDFVVAAATAFLADSKPTAAMLNELWKASIKDTLVQLLANDTDVARIAKLRKTNLSGIAKEAVIKLNDTIMAHSIWDELKPQMLSPRLMALKALETMVLESRNQGNMKAILDQAAIDKLVEITVSSAISPKLLDSDAHIMRALTMSLSILQSSSLGVSADDVWPDSTLQSLANAMPAIFQLDDIHLATLAIKLCITLTNNKPNACRQFSSTAFVQALSQSIVHRFDRLATDLEEQERTETLDMLTLTLGAMINLTEHSEKARTNVDDKQRLIEALVRTFVEGSERADQATSIEESQASVAVGYLSVFLGNICLSPSMRKKVCSHLPGQKLSLLIDKIKEFVRVHEHANRKSKQYDGNEGQEVWNNYAARIMLVAEELERAVN